MKLLLSLFLLFVFSISCHKAKTDTSEKCDIDKTRTENSLKVTISIGVWGTIAMMTGNCMPVFDPNSPSPCKTCPIRRTIRIYEFTTTSQATPSTAGGEYDSFSTRLLKEFQSDGNGFFQVELASGTYTIVSMENNKLHAYSMDGQGGISPLTVSGVKENLNLTIIRAVF